MLEKSKASSVEVSTEFIMLINLYLKSHVQFDLHFLIPGVQWSTNPKLRGVIISFLSAKQASLRDKEVFIPQEIGPDGIDYYGK